MVVGKHQCVQSFEGIPKDVRHRVSQGFFFVSFFLFFLLSFFFNTFFISIKKCQAERLKYEAAAPVRATLHAEAKAQWQASRDTSEV